MKNSALGILPSLGGSIESQRRDGREGLFLNYYLPHYLQNFEEIYYFSYTSERPLENKQIHICESKKQIHRYLYAFLIPFLYKNELKKCKLIRVMHLTGVIPAILTKWLYKIPFVTTYGYDYVNFAEIQGHPIKARLLQVLIPFFLKSADGVIVTTEVLREEVERKISDSSKVRLVPNGVDTSIFKHKRNDPSSQFRMLFIGRLEKQKNTPFLLDILSGLCKKRNVRLTVVGNGSLEYELKTRTMREKLPIDFKGSVPYQSIRDEHANQDAFISTSFAEGHPKALIEAMSSGLCCVVSDVTGNRSLIQNNVNGKLLPLENSNVWVDELIKLIDQRADQTRLGDAARKWIVEHLDIRQTLVQELEFFNMITNS